MKPEKCTCKPDVYGSYVNCPVHALDKQEDESLIQLLKQHKMNTPETRWVNFSEKEPSFLEVVNSSILVRSTNGNYHDAVSAVQHMAVHPSAKELFQWKSLKSNL